MILCTFQIHPKLINYIPKLGTVTLDQMDLPPTLTHSSSNKSQTRTHNLGLIIQSIKSHKNNNLVSLGRKSLNFQVNI
jgi:hypothetical protein